jgi:hypothetical protein
MSGVENFGFFSLCVGKQLGSSLISTNPVQDVPKTERRSRIASFMMAAQAAMFPLKTGCCAGRRNPHFAETPTATSG